MAIQLNANFTTFKPPEIKSELPELTPSTIICRKENVPPVISSIIFSILHPYVDFLTKFQ